MSKIYPEGYEKHLTRELEGKTNGLVKSKSKEYFKREFGLDKNKGCIPWKNCAQGVSKVVKVRLALGTR